MSGKKFKMVAVFMVCISVFSAIEPALAWMDTDKQVEDAKDYAFWGAVGGAALVLFTGGLALVPMAGAAAVGAAAAGAYGGCTEDEKDKVIEVGAEVAKDVAVSVVAGKVGNAITKK